MKVIELLRRFARDEEGVTAVEYGLLTSLISIAIIPSLTAVGVNLSRLFTAVASALAGQPLNL